MEACILYGKGHWEELTPEQYDRLKEYMALVLCREEREHKRMQAMFGK